MEENMIERKKDNEILKENCVDVYSFLSNKETMKDDIILQTASSILKHKIPLNIDCEWFKEYQEIVRPTEKENYYKKIEALKFDPKFELLVKIICSGFYESFEKCKGVDYFAEAELLVNFSIIKERLGIDVLKFEKGFNLFETKEKSQQTVNKIRKKAVKCLKKCKDFERYEKQFKEYLDAKKDQKKAEAQQEQEFVS